MLSESNLTALALFFGRTERTLEVVDSPAVRVVMEVMGEPQETGRWTELHTAMTEVHKGGTRAQLYLAGEEVIVKTTWIERRDHDYKVHYGFWVIPRQ